MLNCRYQKRPKLLNEEQQLKIYWTICFIKVIYWCNKLTFGTTEKVIDCWYYLVNLALKKIFSFGKNENQESVSGRKRKRVTIFALLGVAVAVYSGRIACQSADAKWNFRKINFKLNKIIKFILAGVSFLSWQFYCFKIRCM